MTRHKSKERPARPGEHLLLPTVWPAGLGDPTIDWAAVVRDNQIELRQKFYRAVTKDALSEEQFLLRLMADSAKKLCT